MFNTVYIDSNSLLKNLKHIKSKTNSKICAMVKANAYGLGIKEVVSILSKKVDFFGVENSAEADIVKKYTNTKILIVCALERVVIKDYSYTCCSVDDLQFLISKNRKINIHLKINTGMNRFGCSLYELPILLKLIQNSKLNLEGVFTHFATDDSYVDEQLKIFKKAIKIVKSFGFKPIFHADNSANCFKHNLDMVRVGFNLYCDSFAFTQVSKIEATILQINNVKRGDLVGYNYNFIVPKNMKIAVVSLGYADGFLRAMCGFNLWVNGKPCKVLNVCMDCFMLDVSDLNLNKGDKIFILNKENSIFSYANQLNTSPYEILTNFSKIRARRKIIKNIK